MCNFDLLYERFVWTPFRTFQSPKLGKTAAAVVVGFAGIGLLLSPVSVQSNGFDPGRPKPTPQPDSPPPNDAPEVSCLWVANHGSIGFTVEFDVFTPSGGNLAFERFVLTGSNANDETFDDPSEVESGNQSWLDIPGFDGEHLSPDEKFDYDLTTAEKWRKMITDDGVTARADKQKVYAPICTFEN